MPDELGGLPFPDGDGPDSRDGGAAEEAFAAVVLDAAFVEAARIHEPTAAERMLYATLERAEAEALGEQQGLYPDSDGAGFDELYEDEGRFDRSDYTRYLVDGPLEDERPEATVPVAPRSRVPPARRPSRWQRPMACVLAMVMGLGMIAFALIAVQRAGSAQRTEPVPVPPTGQPDEGRLGDDGRLSDQHDDRDPEEISADGS